MSLSNPSKEYKDYTNHGTNPCNSINCWHTSLWTRFWETHKDPRNHHNLTEKDNKHIECRAHQSFNSINSTKHSCKRCETESIEHSLEHSNFIFKIPILHRLRVFLFICIMFITFFIRTHEVFFNRKSKIIIHNFSLYIWHQNHIVWKTFYHGYIYVIFT